MWLGDAPSVMIDIRRAMGENTVAVIEGVRETLARIERTLPPGVDITIVRDDSRFIYASVASLEEHLVFGALFAAIVVMFFIRNLRAVIISALAIPASIIATFTLMRIMGFTLNNMTLLAITLAVGIVIDDAIVVLENIFRYIEEKNCSPFDAAIQGTREVALPVMATTLSLVVIFLPIAFMEGYAKRFIYPFGWTMAFAILVSMLVSFTLTPMLSSRFLRPSDGMADHKSKESGFFHWLDLRYMGLLNWALDHPRAIFAISALTALLSLPLNYMVGREFVPNEDMGEWIIHLDAPEGTSLEGSAEVGFKLLKALSGIEGVAHIEPSIGVSGGSGASTHVHLMCQALPIDQRKNTQAEMINEMRRRLAAFPGYRPSITSRNALGSGEGTGGFAISANILGPDLEQIATYSTRALAEAQKLPSLADVKINLSLSNPEVHVAVDRKRAADLGVRMATVGNTLRLAVSGDDQISFYKEAAEQYPVKMRVREEQRRDIEEIGRLTVPSAVGPVRIDNIATLQRGLGPSTLSRSNRQFTVMLIADIAQGHALDEAANDVRRMLAGLDLPGDDVVPAAGTVEDSRRDDCQSDHGDLPRDDFCVHGAGLAVRELPPAHRHHAGAAHCRAVRALHAMGDRAHAEPMERARHAAAARDREEEFDPPGGLRQRPARPRAASPRSHHRVVPHPAAADSHDDDRHHRGTHPDVARDRHRGNGTSRYRSDDHRRTVALPAAHSAARSSGVCEVRRARACARRGRREGVAQPRVSGDARPLPAGAGELNAGSFHFVQRFEMRRAQTGAIARRLHSFRPQSCWHAVACM